MYKFLSKGQNFIVFNPHDNYSVIHKETIQCVFIDPGTTHFALRVSKQEKYGIIKTVLHRRENFKNEDINPTNFFVNISSFLNEIKEYLINSNYIIIESQMKSMEMIRTCQHIISISMEIIKNKGNRALIYEVDANLKHKSLGIPKGVKGRDNIKEWCKDLAIRTLLLRDEKDISDSVRLDKKYDISDCICYDIMWYSIYNNNLIING